MAKVLVNEIFEKENKIIFLNTEVEDELRDYLILLSEKEVPSK